MYTDVGGLTEMSLDNNEFQAIFGVDWDANEMRNEIVSDIFIDYFGKNIKITKVTTTNLNGYKEFIM